MIEVFVKSVPFLFDHIVRIKTFPCHYQYTPRSLLIDYWAGLVNRYVNDDLLTINYTAASATRHGQFVNNKKLHADATDWPIVRYLNYSRTMIGFQLPLTLQSKVTRALMQCSGRCKNLYIQGLIWQLILSFKLIRKTILSFSLSLSLSQDLSRCIIWHLRIGTRNVQLLHV